MSQPLILDLPATSANLGPAFDAAALAFDFGLQVEARTAEHPALVARGRDAAICGNPNRHLILEVYRRTLAAAGKPEIPLAIELNNGIPIGKGCGSSAAARLAGLALAVHFGELGWGAQQVFEAAAALEGHADNVAACWWGGLVLVQTPAAAAGTVHWLKLPLAKPWPMLLVAPAAALSTEEARAALPAQYSRADAVTNLQNALLLVAALQQGRGELLAAGFDDRLHQPYRARLCPALPALQPLAGRDGILGVALSGAGPSVLVILENAAARPRAEAAVRTALQRAAVDAELLAAAIAPEGPGMKWSRS